MRDVGAGGTVIPVALGSENGHLFYCIVLQVGIS